MANPFLMDDDLDTADADAAVNPFLMASSGGEGEEEAFDNPFAGQASNPFAFGDEAEVEAVEPDIDPAMSFFGTTIEAEDDNLSIKSVPAEEDEIQKKTAAAAANPPPRPLPPQTQELINTVSNHMEETSSELLGRIPATRSPSPVSMRDLHSPSPTPDSGLADLMDVSDSGSTGNLDNPFGVPTAVPNIQAVTPLPSVVKQQPPRPPPPRPAPPRPTPPAGMQQTQPQPPQRPAPPPKPVEKPSTPTAAETTNAEETEDLMFGTSKPPKPPPPKTKEDILSLFEKPSQSVEKPDLLSDDIILDPTANEPEQESKDTAAAEDPIFTSTLTRPDESTHDITLQPQAAVPPKPGMNTIAPNLSNNMHRAPTPDIEITTVEDLPRSDDEEEEPTPANAATTNAVEVEPEETAISSADYSSPTESATAQIPNESPAFDAVSEVPSSEPELMDTGLDFALATDAPSGAASANPFATPEEEEPYPAATAVAANIFGTDDAEVPTNIFTSMSDESAVVTTAPINIFAAEDDEPAVTQSYAQNLFAAEPDEFDAFSAKFDSVKKDNISILDGFGGGGGSGAVTPTVDGKFENFLYVLFSLYVYFLFQLGEILPLVHPLLLIPQLMVLAMRMMISMPLRHHHHAANQWNQLKKNLVWS